MHAVRDGFVSSSHRTSIMHGVPNRHVQRGRRGAAIERLRELSSWYICCEYRSLAM